MLANTPRGLLSNGCGTKAPWRRLILTVIVGVGMGVVGPASSFNLEPRTAQIFSDPTLGESYWGRESYFGFSVALQRNGLDNSAWLVVGAPRANSSIYIPTRITEPGAIYKCDLSNDRAPCVELKIDQTGNTYTENQNYEFIYHDLKNEGWLGAALDTQPTFEEGRQATGVCAPRWINQAYFGHGTYQINGACYWLNASLSDAPAHKKLPLIQYSKQTFNLDGRPLFYYAHGQAGLSLHFPDDQTEMIIGAPGVFNWQGSVIRLKDAASPVHGEMAFRRRRQVPHSIPSEVQMFSSQSMPNPYYTPSIQDFDLNGYAVTSGRFFNANELLYASGAPRGAYTFGKVFIFSFPERETQSFNIRAEWQGTQVGENFGAALVAMDVNGDGLSDLVVGSPMFSRPDIPDMGRIQVFMSTKLGTMVQTSGYYGSSSPSARFGTTLASPGDMNFDGYEDVAVGAPWENNGKGAVYIYMGSEIGLRQVYAQRLSPEDFPTVPNLSGFGMGISRGIDIDNNDYPDLAIGSFLSGHSLVLKSRTVASVRGNVIASPQTLLLEDTYLTLETCVSYDGHRVPEKIGINGNVTLDYGHVSPRASFSDTGLAFRKFDVVGTSGKTKCLPFTVDVSSNKIDPRRPILVRLEYAIVETADQLMTQPKTDPGQPKITTLPISIVTECESDGDKTCEVDMFVEAYFVSYGEHDKLTIGGDNKPVLEIVVNNLGESVFLPNVTIEVPEPFALYQPSSHNCDFTIKDSRTALVCQLTNPIKRNRQDWLRVTIDASQVTDAASELKVDVAVSGEGVELQPSDNSVFPGLQLLANAQLKLHGYSREEQLHYKRIEEDKINTTLSSSTFTHHYTLVKSGPTPLGQVELVIDIPVNFTEEGRFITLYAPETNFLGQPFLCNVQGTTLAASGAETGNNGNIIPTFGTGDMSIPLETKVRTTILRTRSVSEDVSGDEAKLHEVQTFRCPNEQISCARLRCIINSWPSGSHNADLSIKMDVNFTILASHISARGGAIVGSSATAAVLSLNPDLTFVGNKVTSTIADTHFLPDSLPGRGVAWWIILLAVLGGLLLLCLLAYALYKMGFFKRKEHEEMKAQKAHVECNANY
ncbi:integrin alpha-PS3-like [Macrobrachium nipponense]|uniref:integrin alpha-PS3-like n=1 Tax=Macrobrachium nipponense TaxID=159736 RepID=UPI0030C8BCD4